MINIKKIVKEPESKTLEFKRDLSALKSIMKTLVAFANTAGGILIIGRDDDGTIIGLPDVLQAEESLASAISDSIAPAIMPEIEIFSLQGCQLIILRIARWKGPFYIKNEGPDNGVYIRLGSTNRKAGAEILAELNRSIRGISFDQMPCPETNDKDINKKQIQSVFKDSNKLIDKEKLKNLGLVVSYAGKNVLSNGAIILFGPEKKREYYFPDARVSCARFRTTDKSEFIDRLDIEGGPLDAVDAVPKFIKRNTRLYSKIQTFKRKDIPAYPELAIREVLVNALVHTEYSIVGMRILISIFSDRMEIQNPGMFPFGMTLEDFKSGVSKIRNRVIARIFRELGLMEEWGSGYRRIINFCKNAGYPEPEWIELGSAIRVIFYPHPEAVEEIQDNVPVNVPVNVPANVPANVTANQRQKWFLTQLQNSIKISAFDIAKHWNISEKTAKRDIADLKKKGSISFSGATKNGSYFLINRGC